MDLTVAMEPSLTPYRLYLEDKGYRVVPLDENALEQADVVVVGGTDHQFMGMSDLEYQRKIILAEGLTPSEVEGRIKSLERNAFLRPDNDGQGR